MTSAGEAYSWGYNLFGGLGNGSNNDSNVPVAVVGDLTFQSISAGNYHTCGLTSAGEAYCWGYNSFGQLGDGSNTDRNVPVRVLDPNR